MATEWSLSEEVRLIRERVKVLNHIPKACKQLSERFRELKKILQFNKGQCSYLCDSFSVVLDELSWSIQKEISNIHQKAVELQRKSVRQCADFDHCLSLCRDAFLELNHAIHYGQDIVTACTLEHWCRSAITMSSVSDTEDYGSKELLKSRFGICLRKFLWSLDVVENAFMVLTRNPNFRSRERLNLFFVDSCNSNNSTTSLTLEALTDLLIGNRAMDHNLISTLVHNALHFREVSDRKCLLKKLDNIVADSFRHDFEFTQQQAIAEFLRKKLNGPTPRGDCLPETYWLDHRDLVYVRHLGNGQHTSVDEYDWFGLNVAAKTITSGIDKDTLARRAACLAGIVHPNVVQLIGCAYKEEEQVGMLVIELMDLDLRSLLNGRSSGEVVPFHLVVAIDIMLQIAKAMEYLQERKVLHGDLRAAKVLIKSSNFSGREQFQVKVTDFGQPGSSRLVSSEGDSLHLAQKFEGIRWKAPEVLADLEAVKDRGPHPWAADVYSFGMTCYEILTAKLPYEGTPLATLTKRILAGQRPELPSYCPDYLSECIRQCWAASPIDRPTFGDIRMKFSFFKKLILMRSSRKSWYPSDFIELEKIMLSKCVRSGSGFDFGNITNSSETISN